MVQSDLPIAASFAFSAAAQTVSFNHTNQSAPAGKGAQPHEKRNQHHGAVHPGRL